MLNIHRIKIHPIVSCHLVSHFLVLRGFNMYQSLILMTQIIVLISKKCFRIAIHVKLSDLRDLFTVENVTFVLKFMIITVLLWGHVSVVETPDMLFCFY